MLTKTIHINLSEACTLNWYIESILEIGLFTHIEDDCIAVGRKEHDRDFTFYSYEGYVGFCDGINFEKESQKILKEKGEK